MCHVTCVSKVSYWNQEEPSIDTVVLVSVSIIVVSYRPSLSKKWFKKCHSEHHAAIWAKYRIKIVSINTVSIGIIISGITNCSIISPTVQESNVVLQSKIYAKYDSWFASCQQLAFQFKTSLGREHMGGTRMRYDAIACKWPILW